jgi:hypothetical protein
MCYIALISLGRRGTRAKVLHLACARLGSVEGRCVFPPTVAQKVVYVDHDDKQRRKYGLGALST